MNTKRITRPVGRISISLPQDLQAEVDEMVAQRGVVTGRLQLVAAVIPPLHPLTPPARKSRRKQ